MVDKTVVTPGITTRIKSVKVGRPIRSIIGSSIAFGGLSDTIFTSVSHDNLVQYDSDQQIWVNVPLIETIDSALGNSSTLISTIRGLFSSGPDITYDSSTGQFSLDVEEIYTQQNFDSDFNTTIDSISGHLIPSLDSTYDLGSPTQKWRHLYLSGNTITLGELEISDDGSVFTVRDTSSGLVAPINMEGVTTNDIAEGGENLYYTDQRVHLSLQGTQLGGDGTFEYDRSDGQFYYTGPSATETRAHFSGGTGVTYDSNTGLISIGQSVDSTDDLFFQNVTLSGDLRGPAEFTIDPATHGDSTGKVIVKGDLQVDGSATNIKGNLQVDGSTTTINSSAVILTGHLRGPETFIIDPAAYGDATGKVTILGNLQVDGETTTINSTTLSVNDKNIVLADSAVDSSAAHGAGITVAGANATILYDHTNATWDLNRPLGRDINVLSEHSTSDLTEGSNLYYTTARVNSDIDTRVTKTFVDNLGVDAETLDGISSESFLRSDVLSTKSAGNLIFEDNVQLNIGIDGDLNIYHDGNDTYLHNNTGTFYIQGDTISVTNANGTETLGQFIADSAVKLYFNNNEKIRTTSTGVTITGEAAIDSATISGNLDVGGVFTTITTDGLTEGNNLYYTRARFDSALGDTTSTATIRSYFSAAGDLTYDQSTGEFSFDVEDVYTKANFDSDFNMALDEAVLGGIGIKYDSATNTLAIDSAELESYYKQDIRGYFSASGDLSYDLATGQFSFDVEQVYTKANFDSDFNMALDEAALDGVGIAYDASDNTLRIDSAELESYYKQDIRGYFSAGGDLSYDAATGQFSFDVEEVYTKANFDSDFNVALDEAALGGIGIAYDASDNTLRIDSAELAAYYSTDNITEGSNLYYTTVRADSDFDVRLATKTTSNLTEGSNLYYTTARFDSDFGDNTTSDLTEGSNLYYTTARADSDAKNSISVTDNGGDGSLSYDNETGIISYTGPSATEVRAHFTGGIGTTITAGVIDIGQNVDSAADVTFNSITNSSGTITAMPSEVTVSTDTVTNVDTVAHNNDFMSIDYVIHMDDSDNNQSQISRVILTYNKSNVFYTEYGMASSYSGDSDMGEFSAEADANNIVLKFTRTAGIGTVKVKPVKTIIS